MANKELIINADIALDMKLISLLICLGQEKAADMQRRINPWNLSLLQLHILHVLSEVPGGRLTVNQIKEFMIDDNPNVSRSINKLMENGYITKERSSDDQRVVHIAITETGMQAHEDADTEVLKMSLSLSEKEQQNLFKLLSKL